MAFELQMLALVTFLLMLGWVPGFVCKYQTYGLGWMLSNRSTMGLSPLPEWGQRAERAYDNLQAHYPAFAVAVLLLALTGGFNLRTSLPRPCSRRPGWCICRPIPWASSGSGS